MAKNTPDIIPAEFAGDESTAVAYCDGWSFGHGIACHNVPEMGTRVLSVIVDADNIREVHQDACFEAAMNARQYSPFEHTAHEYNEAENSEELWAAFEAGVAGAIFADLAEYTDEGYGIEPSDNEEGDDE